MTAELEISTEGALGVVALNRPEAVNALSRGMIDGIAEALRSWQDDPSVRLVLFEGRGARGFCSGGDVRAVRSAALERRFEQAHDYFAAEYAMNRLIATYPKPTAALGHGAIMGGGIGIFGHCRYRFAPSGSRFAMPEAAIGFVCDVGVNAILAQVPEHRALAFLMTGLPVGTGDALALGLCDAGIAPDRMAAVRAGIVGAASATDLDTALVLVMQAETVEPNPPMLTEAADRLAAAFASEDARTVVAAVLAAPAAIRKPFDILAQRSPTSLEAILRSHRAARRLPDIAAILALDLQLADDMVRRPDFAEGVRAVLVDKDQAPHWQPPAFPVDGEGLGRVLSTVTG